MDIRETNSDYEMEKRSFANIHFLNKFLRQLLFFEIYLVVHIRFWRYLQHN